VDVLFAKDHEAMLVRRSTLDAHHRRSEDRCLIARGVLDRLQVYTRLEFRVQP
jgi:hypothetical protein